MKYSFLTVVYGRELGRLLLQARSIARFVDPQDVATINIYINDKDPQPLRDAICDNLFEYGAFSSKVRIYTGADAFDLGQYKGFRGYLVEGRWTGFLRRARGWNGIKGHFIQQAFKLRAWRHCAAEGIVILDAKNVFAKNITAADFFNSDGKPRARLAPPSRLQRRWLRASLHCLDVKYTDERFGAALCTDFITPYPIRTEMLREVCEHFEARYCPAHIAFGSKSRNRLVRARLHYTEFMIINAYYHSIGSAPEYHFSGTLFEVDSFFTSTPSAEVDKVISRLSQNQVSVLGFHSSDHLSLSDAQINDIAAELENRDLISNVKDLPELLAIQA